jgi:hypothetical protein
LKLLGFLHQRSLDALEKMASEDVQRMSGMPYFISFFTHFEFRYELNVKLPAPDPDPKNVRVVATALYHAGLENGSFTVERLFDVLFSPGVHAHAMLSVVRTYGVEGETAYHVVFAKLVSDIGSHP